jgi:hypothetical protein
VLAVGALIYIIGALIVMRMRKSRINEETDLTYPAQPANEDDRKALEQIEARQGGPSPERQARIVGGDTPGQSAG